MNYGVGRAITLHYIVTLAAWFCSLGHDMGPRRTPAACHKAYDNLYYEISHQSAGGSCKAWATVYNIQELSMLKSLLLLSKQ